MNFLKTITKYGNSLVISFTKKETRLYNLEEGLTVDLSDWVVLPNKIKPRPLKRQITTKGKRSRV